jgi:ribonuclease HII
MLQKNIGHLEIMDDLYKFENSLWNEGFNRVMGLDEVGRGCLCGPVVAAGVILNPGDKIRGLADSKTLKRETRESLAKEIRLKALFSIVHECSPEEIDHINILQASLTAMVRCTEADGSNPDYLLVDGNRFTATLIPVRCVVKGDSLSASIAAASIIAKVYRDRLMHELHQKYPVYAWNTNVGYPTEAHYDGLKRYGYTKHHRKSFNLRTNKRFKALPNS